MKHFTVFSDPFERPESSFIFVNGHIFYFKNADFAKIASQPKVLPGLKDLLVEDQNGERRKVSEALRKAGIDEELLNPPVSLSRSDLVLSSHFFKTSFVSKFIATSTAIVFTFQIFLFADVCQLQGRASDTFLTFLSTSPA